MTAAPATPTIEAQIASVVRAISYRDKDDTEPLRAVLATLRAVPALVAALEKVREFIVGTEMAVPTLAAIDAAIAAVRGQP